MITLIAATSVNGVLGVRGANKLLWNSKADLGWFKKQTKGQTIVMGNNTFKALGAPLPDRKNIVLSKSEEPGVRNGVIYHNYYGDIIQMYSSFVVIGGESVYNLFLPVADEILITTTSLELPIDSKINYAYFPTQQMESEFIMVGESGVVRDIDRETDTPMNLIFTRWARSLGNIH